MVCRCGYRLPANMKTNDHCNAVNATNYSHPKNKSNPVYGLPLQKNIHHMVAFHATMCCPHPKNKSNPDYGLPLQKTIHHMVAFHATMCCPHPKNKSNPDYGLPLQKGGKGMKKTGITWVWKFYVSPQGKACSYPSTAGGASLATVISLSSGASPASETSTGSQTGLASIVSLSSSQPSSLL